MRSLKTLVTLVAFAAPLAIYSQEPSAEEYDAFEEALDAMLPEETPSQFASGFHAGASVLFVTGTDIWDSGVGGAGRIGYLAAPEESPQLRYGPMLEVAHVSLDGEIFGFDADFSITPIIPGVVIGAAAGDNLMIYAGGGFGVGFASLDVAGESFSDSTTVGQVLFGVEFALNEQVGLRAGYRHFWVGDLEDRGLELDGDDSSVIEAGINLYF